MKNRHFRVEEETDDYMVNFGKEQRIKIHNNILPALVKDHKRLKKLEEQFRLQSEPSLSPIEQEPTDIPCPALIHIPNKGYYCAEKAPRIVHIPSLLICKYCWEQKQTKKATVTTPKPSTLYKKPKDIYCLQLTRHVDPLKVQATCQRCKRDNIYKWGECQEYNRKHPRIQIP